jgi:Ca2+-binding EF-hand superfamily protein
MAMNDSLAGRGRVGFTLVLALIAANAAAQDSDRARQVAAEMQKRFAAADKNGDGRLTKDEAQAGMPYVHKHFDQIDKAKQGSITLADIASFAREQRAARNGAAP